MGKAVHDGVELIAYNTWTFIDVVSSSDGFQKRYASSMWTATSWTKRSSGESARTASTGTRKRSRATAKYNKISTDGCTPYLEYRHRWFDSPYERRLRNIPSPVVEIPHSNSASAGQTETLLLCVFRREKITDTFLLFARIKIAVHGTRLMFHCRFERDKQISICSPVEPRIVPASL